MLVTSIFSFSSMFSTLLEKELVFSVIFILLSANAFNLDQSKILSFGKELKLRNVWYRFSLDVLCFHCYLHRIADTCLVYILMYFLLLPISELGS